MNIIFSHSGHFSQSFFCYNKWGKSVKESVNYIYS